MESIKKINKLIDMAEKRKRRSRSKSPKSKVDDLIRLTEQRKVHLGNEKRRHHQAELSKLNHLINIAEQRKREFSKKYVNRTFHELHRANVPHYAPARKSSSPKTHKKKYKIKFHNNPYDIHGSNVTRNYLEHLKHKTRRSR